MGHRKGRANRSWPTAVDLFSGSGAVTSALRSTRFKVIAAVDNDREAAETFRLNHPSVKLYEKDIRKLDPHVIRTGPAKGRDIDLLVVCAPCQPFSTQNRKRKPDEREALILQAGRFARVLQPRVIFFENVPGLAARSDLLIQLRAELGENYELGSPTKIDAADLGVPQRRNRCIMIATRDCIPPDFDELVQRPAVLETVRQAIGHLPSLATGQSDPDDPLHVARRHSDLTLRRLAHIPKDGGSRSALPRALVLPCHAKLDPGAFSDVYGRMSWDDVAPTLTTGCTDVTRGRYAHPRDDRAITLREAALLQTFPSTYRFAGRHGAISRQIGNAVPVRLVEALARGLRGHILATRA